MGTRCSFPGVKRSGRETDHSPPYSVEIKNACSYISTPNTSSVKAGLDAKQRWRLECCGDNVKNVESFRLADQPLNGVISVNSGTYCWSVRLYSYLWNVSGLINAALSADPIAEQVLPQVTKGMWERYCNIIIITNQVGDPYGLQEL